MATLATDSVLTVSPDRLGLTDKSTGPLFVVTVDTEADDAWVSPETIELNNLTEIPRFQELCQSYGVIPTYLVTYECAARDEAISVLKPISDRGQCEIGHHLHCWTTPPFAKESPSGVDSAWLGAYQSELPDSLFREKAECLRDEIAKAYGKSPTSHRAGRWGIDQRSIDWLIENDFTVESSVTPLISWSTSLGSTTGGPSFYSSPRQPYFWYANSASKRSNPFLIEIPLTVDFPEGLFLRACAAYLQRELPGTSMVDHIYKKLGGSRMFRPNPSYPENTLLGIVDRTIQHGSSVLNLMIHSSELALQQSPFSQTKEDCARVWHTLEATFQHVKRIGVTPVSLSEAAMLLRQKM